MERSFPGWHVQRVRLLGVAWNAALASANLEKVHDVLARPAGHFKTSKSLSVETNDNSHQEAALRFRLANS
ncbi:hypothetical protein [Acidithrix sp. C25]|uniref:hypothetical protein n=1 Tax=Acidithrix sp. C25 TaxID=1671482 RepID=UPI00191BAF45|nr:hypothetical protein [Acidithrix sp. C25]